MAIHRVITHNTKYKQYKHHTSTAVSPQRTRRGTQSRAEIRPFSPHDQRPIPHRTAHTHIHMDAADIPRLPPCSPPTTQQ